MDPGVSSVGQPGSFIQIINVNVIIYSLGIVVLCTFTQS
jgi:hypothetical protein